MAQVMFHGTHGNEDAERATLPILMGNAAVTSGQDAIVVLTAEGVRLATKGYVDDIESDGKPPLRDLMASFLSNGGRLWACGSCTTPRGIAGEDLVEGAEIVTAPTILEGQLGSASTLSW